MRATKNASTIDGVDYLSSDYRLKCYTSEWSTNAAIAGGGFVLYVFGIPAFFYAKLWANQEALHPPEDPEQPPHPDHEKVVKQLGFLYLGYTPSKWWYEIALLMQKLMLTGLLIFIK